MPRLTALLAATALVGCSFAVDPILPPEPESPATDDVGRDLSAFAPTAAPERPAPADRAARAGDIDRLDRSDLRDAVPPDEAGTLEQPDEPKGTEPAEAEPAYVPGTDWVCTGELDGHPVRYTAVYWPEGSLTSCSYVDGDGQVEWEQSYQLRGDRPDLTCWVGEFGFAVHDGHPYVALADGISTWLIDCTRTEPS